MASSDRIYSQQQSAVLFLYLFYLNVAFETKTISVKSTTLNFLVHIPFFGLMNQKELKFKFSKIC